MVKALLSVERMQAFQIFIYKNVATQQKSRKTKQEMEANKQNFTKEIMREEIGNYKQRSIQMKGGIANVDG